MVVGIVAVASPLLKSKKTDSLQEGAWAVRVSLDLSSLGYDARGIPLVVRRQLVCDGLHGGLLDG